MLFGGVDEIHLWKKLEELNQIYETSLSTERARYDALIADHQKSCDAMIANIRNLLKEGLPDRIQMSDLFTGYSSREEVRR